MKAVRKIRSLLHQPKPIDGDNAFKALDRAASNMMREHAEKIERARRYWVCPFAGYGRNPL
jgi:hypothetical protein